MTIARTSTESGLQAASPVLKHLFLFFSLWFVLLSLAGIADAQLTWEKDRFDVKASADDTNASVDFKFKNSGTYPVTITRVHASCGCTTAKLDKMNYLPGEEGQIHVTFNFGSRTGHQEKKVTVSMEDATQPTTVLSLAVDIPKFLEITPGFLIWSVGQEGSSQTIHLKVLQNSITRITDVRSDNSQFIPTLETVKEGQNYNVSVKPTDVSAPTKATIAITALLPDKKLKVYSVYAMVRTPRSKTAQIFSSPQK